MTFDGSDSSSEILRHIEKMSHKLLYLVRLR